MRYFLVVLLIIFFQGCSYKEMNEKLFGDKIEFEKPTNDEIYLEVSKSSDLNASFTIEVEDLKKQLIKQFEKEDIKVIDENTKEVSSLKLDLSFENINTKKTLRNSIINNSNIRISIGKVFGNFGISGSVGTKVGDLIKDDSTYEEYQAIFDVSYEFSEDDIKNTQIEVVSSLDDNADKNSTITQNEIKEEVASSIIELFKTF